MHPGLVAVAREKLGAIAEERRVRKDVVLDDDRLGHPVEHAGEPRLDALAASQVAFGIIGLERAVPIDPLDDGAGLGALVLILGNVPARAVGDDEKPLGPRLAHAREDAPRQLRPVEHHHDDGGLERFRHRVAHGPRPTSRLSRPAMVFLRFTGRPSPGISTIEAPSCMARTTAPMSR